MICIIYCRNTNVCKATIGRNVLRIAQVFFFNISMSSVIISFNNCVHLEIPFHRADINNDVMIYWYYWNNKLLLTKSLLKLSNLLDHLKCLCLNNIVLIGHVDHWTVYQDWHRFASNKLVAQGSYTHMWSANTVCQKVNIS